MSLNVPDKAGVIVEPLCGAVAKVVNGQLCAVIARIDWSAGAFAVHVWWWVFNGSHDKNKTHKCAGIYNEPEDRTKFVNSCAHTLD